MYNQGLSGDAFTSFLVTFFLQHAMQRKMIRIGDSREEKGEREEMGHPSGNISMNMVLLKGLDRTQQSKINVMSSWREQSCIL